MVPAQKFQKALKKEGYTVELIEGDRGVFDVWENDKLVFSKHQESRFPEIAEITSHLGN